MKYQKIINLLDNTPNQPSKDKRMGRNRWWTHDEVNQIRFKTSIIRSR